MTHPHETVLRNAYAAFNRDDLDGFLEPFADDAVLHGADGDVEGKEGIRAVVEMLRQLSGGTLRIEVHDVLANDEHTVVLQTTRAERGGEQLADRVVYVFHVRDGLITDAWFQGDPRVQEAFYAT